jgi:hypothetical protein
MKRNYLSWFADASYKLVANYGVRPRVLFIISAALVLLGAFVFSDPATVIYAHAKEGVIQRPAAWSFLNGLGVSIHQFLPVDLPVGSDWQPTWEPLSMTVAGHRLTTYYIRPTGVATVLLRIPGWLLVPLAVASLAGVLRRSGVPTS